MTGDERAVRLLTRYGIAPTLAVYAFAVYLAWPHLTGAVQAVGAALRAVVGIVA